MTKKTIKTEKVLAAFRVLNTAKYSKMSDEDKIKVWKIARALKPVAEEFDDKTKDAAKKMMPSEDYSERLQKAQEFERMRNANEDMSKAPIGAAEYEAFLKEFQGYNKLVTDAIKEFGDKDVEVEFEPLNDEAFGKLMASNDWTVEHVVELGSLIM